MSNLAKKLLGTTSGGGPVDIADAFSADIYTGNGSTQTISNGIDLAGEGGLVWLKERNSSIFGHYLVDTERGVNKVVQSQSTFSEQLLAGTVTGFDASGFSLGSNSGTNRSSIDYAAWTFRKAPKFFDVVTYTGDGTAGRTIPHNLGVAPGMIVIKRLNSTANWPVYHRSNTGAPETDYLYLNEADATGDNNQFWNDTAPTDTVFSVGINAEVNQNGSTHVAYLFAHDTEADGVIQCGSYTGNGSTVGPTIPLGWEPQYLMIKLASTLSMDWVIFDQARGTDSFGPGTLFTASGEERLFANEADAEVGGGSANYLELTNGGTAVRLRADDPLVNFSGGEHIYVAIRAEGV